jgi:hypothetical protein
MGQDNRGGGLPIAPLIALLLFTGGLLVQHEPLQSDRPVAQVRVQTVPHYGQDIEARLWQDPLEAVQSAERAQLDGNQTKLGNSTDADCGVPSAKCHKATWLQEAISGAGDDTLILPVMIFGGPYAEDVEERRRNRYAVLSNLLDSGYQPVYSRGIGYTRFDDAAVQKDGLPRLMPFERWERDGKADASINTASRYAHVFVLWLTEESLVPGAPVRLKELFRQVLPAKASHLNVDVKVIGPTSQETSDELQPIFGEKDRYGHPCDNDEAAVWSGSCVEFLAPRLTAVSDVASDGKPRTPLRFSPSDRQIARTLIDELRNRNLNLPDASNTRQCLGEETNLDHIAIVVEADTHYGRSLEREFRAALACGDASRQTLHVFRYFRGLDGRTSQKEDEGKKSASSSASGAARDTTAPQERTQGQSQFDYLLRIASWAREQNDRLGSRTRESGPFFDFSPSGRSIRAVVVLGSDIYDKLAILHALRERLPQAIFATTDLDAGFLQNDQLRWTRNLVVSSGYDLRLHRNMARCKPGQDCPLAGVTGDGGVNPQRGAPPFRDTYQSATFLAVSKALAVARNDPSIECPRTMALSYPRLFEIGDGAAVQLVPRAPQHPVAAESLPMEQCRADQLDSPFGAWSALRLAIGLAAVLLFGLAFSWCLRGVVRQHWPALGAASLLIGAYAVNVARISASPGEEPLRWLDGISIWPSEFVRLIVVILGVGLFLNARSRLREGEERIAHEFFRVDAPPAHLERPWWVRLGEDFRLFWASGFVGMCRRVCPPLSGQRGEHSVAVEDLWRDYRQWISVTTVALRIAIGVTLYSVLSLVLISLDPPIAPVRGPASLALDHFTAAAAVLSMLLLLVATLGRVAVSTLFLRRLYGDGAVAMPSDWSAATLNRFCGASCKAAKSYVDLMLSARMTESVGEIVLYPFILSVLLLVARSSLFDNWVTPRGLLVMIAFGLALVIIAALALRHSAERIRRYTIEQLVKLEVRMHGSLGAEEDKSCDAATVRLMREVATNLNKGAFAPLAEQPIVRALILPFGGAGAMSLLEYVLMAKA